MELIQAPISSLAESPFNYRRHFSDESLRELAVNIRAIGLQQPIKVRPIPGAQTIIDKDYEIIFGHRRFRAAQLADLEVVPILVQDMTDEQVRIAQLSENIQREDTSPIEEAEGLRALIDECGLKVEDIIVDTGKSRRHIYNTLRLVKLGTEARAAIESKLIGREIAVLISALPTSLQKKALSLVTVQDAATGEKTALSFRKAKQVLATSLYIPIASASFDPTNALLAKVAGACTVCPHLSQNDESLCDELPADMCTDPECFEVKSKTHATLLALKTKADGGFVLEGEEADSARPYAGADWFHNHTSLEKPLKDGDQQRTVRDVLEEMQDQDIDDVPVPGLHIDSKTHKPTEIIDDAGMERVRSYLIQKNNQAESRPQEPKTQAARVFASPLHEKAHRHHKAIRNAARTACLTGDRKADEARLLAAHLLDVISHDDITPELIAHFGWTDEIKSALESDEIDQYDVGRWIIDKKLDNLSPMDWSTIAVYLAVSNLPAGFAGDEQFPQRAIELANVYEIDIEQIADQAEQASQDDDDEDGDEE